MRNAVGPKSANWALGLFCFLFLFIIFFIIGPELAQYIFENENLKAYLDKNLVFTTASLQLDQKKTVSSYLYFTRKPATPFIFLIYVVSKSRTTNLHIDES